MPAKHVPELLAVMATAGFYDESGDWMYTAGLPAKTGVGGGIVAVVPGRFAIAAFSPRLNEAGNSVRSLNAIRDIAGELGVGVFGPTRNNSCGTPRPREPGMGRGVLSFPDGVQMTDQAALVKYLGGLLDTRRAS
jgi:hypothetical protein